MQVIPQFKKGVSCSDRYECMKYLDLMIFSS